MRNISVGWGSAPNASAPLASLGRALAGAMGGGNSSKAARDAAYIESLNRHNQLVDAQTAAAQQKMQNDQSLTQIKLNDDQRTADQATRAQTAAAAAADAEMQRRVPAPAGIGVLAPTEPAIVEYDKKYGDLKPSVQSDLSYIYGNGDGTPESRAGAVSKSAGANLIRAGDANDYLRGNALNGHTLSSKDMVPGENSPVPINPDGSAVKGGGKPVFNKDKTQVLVPDPNDPSGYKYVSVGGQKKTTSDIESLETADRALSAYQTLDQEGDIGPWIGSDTSQGIAHFFGTKGAGLREEYEAARNHLILLERKRLLSGQGAVSDSEGKQIERMFPTFNAANPQVGIKTLMEMKKRIEGGNGLLYDKGTGHYEAPGEGANSGGDHPEGTIAENPDTGEKKVLRNGVWEDM